MATGTNILFYYPNKVVHFCFVSGLTRTADVPDHVLTMSLHADGRISIISLQAKHEDAYPITEGEAYGQEWEDYQLQVVMISLQGDNFQCSPLQPHDLSSFISPHEGWDVSFKTDGPIFYSGGFSQTLDRTREVPDGDPEINETMYFTLEADDTLTVHCVSKSQWAGLPSCRFDQGLVYALQSYPPEQVNIGLEKRVFSFPGVVMYLLDLCQSRPLSLPGLPEDSTTVWGLWGDNEFVVFYSKCGVFVWSFDQNWKRSGILK
jgi:hypothetical protein